MQSTSEREGATLVEDLEAAAAALDDAEAAVEDVGEDAVRQVADAAAEARQLLAKYEDSATGTGDFESYVRFQEKVADFVEGLDEDLPRRSAFEDYEDAVDGRRLSTADFEAARDALDPAEAVEERIEARDDARARYREARRVVRERLDDVEGDIAERERVARLGDADLSAPVEELADPIETYDEAVTDAFDAFKREAPAREVLSLVAAVSERSFVDFRAPDDALLAYVREADAGEEPVSTLLTYAGHSRSKLGHYVDDADALKRVVATRQTYLERLDAEPLTVGWPPPRAAVLRRRASAYESVVRRFGDETVVARCREVRRLTRRDDYADLRRAAVARDELTEGQRRALREGRLESELSALKNERERLRAALDEHPER
jgi:hypothetical protein